MAMNPKCVAAVHAAAGDRKISDAKLKAIEDAIGGKMHELARRDRQRWRGLSRDQRMSEAMAAAIEDVKAEAALKEHREHLQLLRAVETEARIGQQMQLTGATRSQGLSRDIRNTGIYEHAVRDEAISGLRLLLDAVTEKDGIGLLRRIGMSIFDLDNPRMTADVVREVFANADGHTGNAAAAKAAQAWLSVIESMRQRFNAAGGAIGKLGYGYLAQAHDAVKVAAAGAEAWARKVLPLLDREQYVHEDGSLMSDAEMLSMLEGAHKTIALEGDNKRPPGQFAGTGARANRGSDHRALHFRDGEAWMTYMGEFGEGSLYDAMMGHIGRMARDIALVERYGPNPEQQFRVQADIAQRADGAGTLANRFEHNTPDAYWSLVSGKTGTPENLLLAQVGQDARNWQTAAKLGGTLVSAITDTGTILASLHYNRLPYFETLKNFVTLSAQRLGSVATRGRVDTEAREFLTAHGVIAEALSSTLNRWTGDHMTHSLSGRVAGSVMKLNFNNAWSDGLRGAFALTMMRGFTSKLGKAWGELDEWDRWLMGRKGLSEQDWQVITQATPTDRGGHGYLTATAVAAVDHPDARQAATRWLAFVSDETQFAVVNPDMATRAIVTGGGMPAGTIRGEAARAFYQFKSFPIAMLTRHWRRIFETPQGLEGAPMGYGAKTAGGAAMNRVAVLAALNVTLTMLGAAVLQTKALLAGKDPYDMTEGRFWMRALAQGGGMGFLGDLLFKDPTEQRGNTVEQSVGVVAGPVAGTVAGLVGDLGVVNAWEAAKGKDTHMAAEALRWVNSQLPYTSLWEVRGAWEHWFLHNAQEAVNPGYLSRMQQRAMQDWGQGYFWAPGEAAPDRAPDFARMTGE